MTPVAWRNGAPTKLLWLPLVFLLLAGCAQTPRLDAESVDVTRRWSERKQKIYTLDNWELRGRVAIQASGEGFSGKLVWAQSGDEYQLRLEAPFGQASYQLIGTPTRVSLLAPDQAPVHAPEPAALLQSQLGWSLPISGLRHWVLGVPEPDAQITQLQLDKLGRLSILHQSGWQISVKRYGRLGDVDVPSKLYLDRESLRVRLVVHKWKTG